MTYVPIIGSICIAVFMLTERRSRRALFKAFLFCAALFGSLFLLAQHMEGNALVLIVVLALGVSIHWLCFLALIVALFATRSAEEPSSDQEPASSIGDPPPASRRRLLVTAAVLIPVLGLYALVWKFNSERICVGYSEFGGCTQRLAILHNAAAKGQVPLARWLIRLGFDVNGGDEYEAPPIIWAIQGTRPDMVRMLLDRGASLKLTQRNVSRGIGRGTAHAFNVLCGYPSTGEHGTPPAAERLIAIGEMLFEAGADPNYVGDTGATPLSYCIATGRLGLARYLLKRGADAGLAGNYGPGGPLFAAFKRRDEQLISELLAAGARCTRADVERAISYRVDRYIDECLTRGFEFTGPRSLSNERVRLNFLAALNGLQLSAVRMLLAAGISANDPYPSGERPIHIVIQAAKDERTIPAARSIIRCLRTHGADVTLKNSPDRRVYPNRVPENALEFAQRTNPALLSVLLEGASTRCEP